MVELIKNNLDRIQDVCKRHHVKSLYLFGSATKQDNQYNSESDVDLLYRFNKSEINEMEYADNYFNLLFALQSLLNRNIDLVPEEKLSNPYFIERVNRDRHKIYEQYN
jgi:predicted nucleotidyltransferase